MANGYTRQSSGVIVNTNTINASDFNNEFNALQAAFSASTGHTHDGTVGGGAPLPSAAYQPNSVNNAALATMAGNTFKGNNTGSSATPVDMSALQALQTMSSAFGILSSTLASPVTLTGSFQDTVSISQGTAGTWFVIATITANSNSQTDDLILLKLYDGTNTINTSQFCIPNTAASFQSYNSGTIFGVITNPTGNLRVAVRDATSSNGSVGANNSFITAIRLG